MTWTVDKLEFSAELVNPELGGVSLLTQENQQQFSVVFEDDVSKFFNVLHLDVRDPRALIKESLLHSNGTHIKAGLARTNVIPDALKLYSLSGEYTNLGAQYILGSQDSDVPDEIHMTLVNSFFDKEVVRSRAYRGRISEVVKQVMTSAGWNEKYLDIDECSNEDVWYQMGMTDAHFIKDVLAVNAVAHDADNTPFAAYITSNGVFHFKNLGKLWLSKSVMTTAMVSLTVRDRTEAAPHDSNLGDKAVTEDERNDLARGKVDPMRAIKMWRKDPLSFVEQRRELLHGECRLDMATGVLASQQISATKFPTNQKEKFGREIRTLRLLEPQALEAYSESVNFLNNSRGTKTKQAEEENLLGQRISRMWKHLISDRYTILMTEYCPQVHAGDSILVGAVSTATKSRRSLTHTDRYFVERSRHGWNRQSQTAESVLTISRWGVGEG